MSENVEKDDKERIEMRTWIRSVFRLFSVPVSLFAVASGLFVILVFLLNWRAGLFKLSMLYVGLCGIAGGISTMYYIKRGKMDERIRAGVLLGWIYSLGWLFVSSI